MDRSMSTSDFIAGVEKITGVKGAAADCTRGDLSAVRVCTKPSASLEFTPCPDSVVQRGSCSSSLRWPSSSEKKEMLLKDAEMDTVIIAN